MGFYFIRDFKEIRNFCALNCYLENINKEPKDNSYKKTIKEKLEAIARFCEDEKTKSLAENALEKCEQCNYKNPGVFDYLDRQEIRF